MVDIHTCYYRRTLVGALLRQAQDLPVQGNCFRAGQSFVWVPLVGALREKRTEQPLQNPIWNETHP
jgi:hypothetical protein